MTRWGAIEKTEAANRAPELDYIPTMFWEPNRRLLIRARVGSLESRRRPRVHFAGDLKSLGS